MNKIVALVLTYNREKLLRECMDSILRQQAVCDLLVVDNASTDHTAEMVNAYVKNNANVSYVNTGANLGGAGGFSFGIKECVQRGYEYIWLMDDDTIPYPDSLQKLIDANEKLGEKYGFLSSLVEWTDGSLCKMNEPLVADNWWEKGRFLQDGYVPTKKGSFVSFFIKCETVRRVGLPIKEFFIWYDDSEYSRRIVENVEVGYLISNSIVLHKMANNSAVDIITENSDRLARYKGAYRNRCYMQKRRGITVKIKYCAFIIRTVVNILRKAKDKKFKRIGIVLGGTIDGIRFNPHIEYVE